MSTVFEATENIKQTTVAEKLALLTQLPVQLARVSEHQVLQTAAEAVISVYDEVRYVRILLVSKNYQPSQLLEWCSDKRLTASMAALENSSTTAQQAAMRRGVALHTQQLHPTSTGYEDWRLLCQQFGMQSFAAVPLTVAGTIYGVIMAASPTVGCFSSSSLQLLETAAHMLSPYAAVMYKYEQVTATKRLLRQILPARVVDAAIERLGMGNMSAADMFSDVNQEFPLG